jgi:hypothetical protein
LSKALCQKLKDQSPLFKVQEQKLKGQGYVSKAQSPLLKA